MPNDYPHSEDGFTAKKLLRWSIVLCLSLLFFIPLYSILVGLVQESYHTDIAIVRHHVGILSWVILAGLISMGSFYIIYSQRKELEIHARHMLLSLITIVAALILSIASAIYHISDVCDPFSVIVAIFLPLLHLPIFARSYRLYKVFRVIHSPLTLFDLLDNNQNTDTQYSPPLTSAPNHTPFAHNPYNHSALRESESSAVNGSILARPQLNGGHVTIPNSNGHAEKHSSRQTYAPAQQALLQPAIVPQITVKRNSLIAPMPTTHLDVQQRPSVSGNQPRVGSPDMPVGSAEDTTFTMTLTVGSSHENAVLGGNPENPSRNRGSLINPEISKDPESADYRDLSSSMQHKLARMALEPKPQSLLLAQVNWNSGTSLGNDIFLNSHSQSRDDMIDDLQVSNQVDLMLRDSDGDDDDDYHVDVALISGKQSTSKNVQMSGNNAASSEERLLKSSITSDLDVKHSHSSLYRSEFDGAPKESNGDPSSNSFVEKLNSQSKTNGASQFKLVLPKPQRTETSTTSNPEPFPTNFPAPIPITTNRITANISAVGDVPSSRPADHSTQHSISRQYPFSFGTSVTGNSYIPGSIMQATSWIVQPHPFSQQPRFGNPSNQFSPQEYNIPGSNTLSMPTKGGNHLQQPQIGSISMYSGHIPLTNAPMFGANMSVVADGLGSYIPNATGMSMPQAFSMPIGSFIVPSTPMNQESRLGNLPPHMNSGASKTGFSSSLSPGNISTDPHNNSMSSHASSDNTVLPRTNSNTTSRHTHRSTALHPPTSMCVYSLSSNETGSDIYSLYDHRRTSQSVQLDDKTLLRKLLFVWLPLALIFMILALSVDSNITAAPYVCTSTTNAGLSTRVAVINIIMHVILMIFLLICVSVSSVSWAAFDFSHELWVMLFCEALCLLVHIYCLIIHAYARHLILWILILRIGVVIFTLTVLPLAKKRVHTTLAEISDECADHHMSLLTRALHDQQAEMISKALAAVPALGRGVNAEQNNTYIDIASENNPMFEDISSPLIFVGNYKNITPAQWFSFPLPSPPALSELLHSPIGYSTFHDYLAALSGESMLYAHIQIRATLALAREVYSIYKNDDYLDVDLVQSLYSCSTELRKTHMLTHNSTCRKTHQRTSQLEPPDQTLHNMDVAHTCVYCSLPTYLTGAFGDALTTHVSILLRVIDRRAREERMWSGLAGEDDSSVYTETSELRNGLDVSVSRAFESVQDAPIRKFTPEEKTHLENLERIPNSASTTSVRVDLATPNDASVAAAMAARNTEKEKAYEEWIRSQDYQPITIVNKRKYRPNADNIGMINSTTGGDPQTKLSKAFSHGRSPEKQPKRAALSAFSMSNLLISPVTHNNPSITSSNDIKASPPHPNSDSIGKTDIKPTKTHTRVLVSSFVASNIVGSSPKAGSLSNNTFLRGTAHLAEGQRSPRLEDAASRSIDNQCHSNALNDVNPVDINLYSTSLSREASNHRTNPSHLEKLSQWASPQSLTDALSLLQMASSVGIGSSNTGIGGSAGVGGSPDTGLQLVRAFSGYTNRGFTVANTQNGKGYQSGFVNTSSGGNIDANNRNKNDVVESETKTTATNDRAMHAVAALPLTTTYENSTAEDSMVSSRAEADAESQSGDASDETMISLVSELFFVLSDIDALITSALVSHHRDFASSDEWRALYYRVRWVNHCANLLHANDLCEQIDYL